MDRPTYEADRLSVRLLDLFTGKSRNLTADTDLSFGSIAWTADGKGLIATAQKVLDTPAFQIDIATGKVTGEPRQPATKRISATSPRCPAVACCSRGIRSGRRPNFICRNGCGRRAR